MINCINDEAKFSSKYMGMKWDRQKLLWEARVTLDTKSVFAGLFYDGAAGGEGA
jgi:hypothetical protein